MIVELLLGIGAGAMAISAIASGVARLRQKALPPKSEQCACTTDDEGLLRCEGRADPRCRGGNCSRHCHQFCGERCKEERKPAVVASVARSLCASMSSRYDRCKGVADPRCDGGNCTEHCTEHCGGACRRGLKAVK